MKERLKVEKLLDLPNVGKILEKNLTDIGINSPDDLRRMGYKEVFLKIRKLDPGACLHMLYGIEGAIENIKDNDLSLETKNQLKSFYNNLK